MGVPSFMLENKQRISTFDLLKGFGMLCIIAGHLFDGFLYPFVFTFHVPLFLLIGGYFYHGKREKWKHHIRRLLKTYLFAVLSVLVLDIIKNLFQGMAVGKIPGFQEIGGLISYWLLAGIYGSGSRSDFFAFDMPVIGAVWFLLAYIWVQIFMKLMEKQTEKASEREKRWIPPVIVSVLFLFGFWTAKGTWLPLSLQAGCVSLLFFYLGYLEKKNLYRLAGNKALIAVSCLAWGIAVLFSIRHDFMSLARCAFPDLPINLLGACAAMLVLFAAAKALEDHRLLPRVRGWLEWIGRNTLPFLCFHLMELNVFPWELVGGLGLNPVWEQILIYCIKLMWCMLGTAAAERMKSLKWIFR